MSFIDVTIAQIETGLESANDVTHRKRAEDLVDFEKVSELSWDLPREKTVGFRLLAEAKPVAFVVGATRVVGGQMEKPE